MKKRSARIQRTTKETDIIVSLTVDGTGRCRIDCGVPFMNHMLELFARHSLMNLTIQARGDIDVDYHHTVEDVGLVLGSALDKALGDRKGITRYGCALDPMDEALSRAVVDLGGRPFLVKEMSCRKRRIMDFSLDLVDEFLRAFTVQSRMNLHVEQFYGAEAHHAYESVFKAVARALRQACAPDAREKGVPSSKGSI